MTAPEISCVVPTYDRADLAARCLTSIAAQRDTAIEIIVTDDSPSPAIRDLVDALAPFTSSMRFLEGPRTGNPVDNWNAGLGEARAPLHVLIHQDEFLVDPLYLRRAVDALNDPVVAATLAGVAVTGVNRRSRFALVAPVAGRIWGARRLLPLVNWIGPTGTLVFRAGPRFDRRLVHLVDVEFYRRVLEMGRLVRLPGVGVGSLGHHDGQISAGFDQTAVALNELADLAARRPPAISPVEYMVFSTALKLRRRLG
jgi:glycosyltransferase involved in cell wall biosynthesis